MKTFKLLFSTFLALNASAEFSVGLSGLVSKKTYSYKESTKTLLELNRLSVDIENAGCDAANKERINAEFQKKEERYRRSCSKN